MVGDSGIGPITMALAWIAPSLRGPVSSASIRPLFKNSTNRSKACPDNLLLFFHHVPYTYVLHSGKTVIQHIYDSHYEGAQRAQEFIAQWKTLDGHIDSERYKNILGRFEYQAGEAIVWRDAICNWIYRLSGIPDQKGRVSTNAPQ